jgi:hypothetical protein
VDGTASRVQRGQESASSVLRFIVTAADGAKAVIEMRGQEIRGALDDGDHVSVLGARRDASDGVFRPARVRNETTGSLVTAWQPPLHQRAAKPLVTALASALISSAVTLLVGWLTSAESSKPTAVPPRPPSAEDDTDWVAIVAGLLVAAAVSWAVWSALFGRRRRRRRRPTWPVALGIVVGLLLGLWVLGS